MSMLRRILLKLALSVCVLLTLVLSVRRCVNKLLGPQRVQVAEEAPTVEVPPPLVRSRDAVQVARRVDSVTVEVTKVRVQGGERYSATVTIEQGDLAGKKSAIALGLRAVDPGWFHEFRGRRLDPVSADVLPGFDADLLLVEQPLPLLALEFEPQLGVSLSSRGPSLLAAATGLRVSGFHLGAFVARDRVDWSAGSYLSVHPRPHWSLGLGWDVVQRTPHVALTFTL